MPTPAARYRGQRGRLLLRNPTVTVNVNGRTEQRQQQVRRTRWYPASGAVARRFDDVLVMASTSLPQPLGDELTPWDLGELVPYQPDYLAGFQAEGYTVPLAEGHKTARAAHGRRHPAATCAATSAATSSGSMAIDTAAFGRDLQAHPAAGLDGRLQVQRQELPLPRQRPDRRGAGRTPLVDLEDPVSPCCSPPFSSGSRVYVAEQNGAIRFDGGTHRIRRPVLRLWPDDPVWQPLDPLQHPERRIGIWPLSTAIHPRRLPVRIRIGVASQDWHREAPPRPKAVALRPMHAAGHRRLGRFDPARSWFLFGTTTRIDAASCPCLAAKHTASYRSASNSSIDGSPVTAIPRLA